MACTHMAIVGISGSSVPISFLRGVCASPLTTCTQSANSTLESQKENTITNQKSRNIPFLGEAPVTKKNHEAAGFSLVFSSA